MNKSEIQKKYYRSKKGQEKLRKQNELRRNKTKFKNMLRQLVSVYELTKSLSRDQVPVPLKGGSKLRFLIVL